MVKDVQCAYSSVLFIRMPYLGKLQKLLIQHDNNGGNPAWHLFKVDVTCAKDKQVGAHH